MDSVLSKNSCEIAAVKRAQIIQRVLVDGWSPAMAAAVFELPERRIARWVNEYKRRGMASLRDDDLGERLFQRWMHSLASAVSRCYAGLRRGFGLVEPAPCVVDHSTASIILYEVCAAKRGVGAGGHLPVAQQKNFSPAKAQRRKVKQLSSFAPLRLCGKNSFNH